MNLELPHPLSLLRYLQHGAASYRHAVKQLLQIGVVVWAQSSVKASAVFVGESTVENAATWIAREYFMRADQGPTDIFELSHEDAEVYFPKFGFRIGRNSFLEMVKGFEGALEYIQHDYGGSTFIP